MKDEIQIKPILSGWEAWKLTQGGIGQNLFYKMLSRGEIPGAFNIGQGNKPIWRVKTKPFLAWLNGETDSQNKTPHGAA
ncbi:MAG: hypothetical protein SFU83_09945 [Meiothermus sp.]|nr:hypothetical protein [Meiothermus sp.]